jgi:PAS domain S-box-containing protein
LTEYNLSFKITELILRFFRRLPLPVKLFLIVCIPLAIILFMLVQLYQEKTNKVNLLSDYVKNIHQTSTLNFLIECLQKERKFSFDYSIRKERSDEVTYRRQLTDSTIIQLEKEQLEGFTKYTFLDRLSLTRSRIDSEIIAPDQVMQFYNAAIFRLNSLNVVPPGTDIYMQPIHQDLVSEKMLSEMVTRLGIIRSDIYNSLYTKNQTSEMLAYIIRLYDIFKSYETEFLQKASLSSVAEFNKIKAGPNLSVTLNYIDSTYQNRKLDSTYDAATWWTQSDNGIEELRALQYSISAGTNKIADAILHKERNNRNVMMIILISILVFVIWFILYTTYGIIRMMRKMNRIAKMISLGAPAPPLGFKSKDVISALAQSISAIDENNKILADAAQQIGKGDFNVNVIPRSKDDILGNAVLQMKESLIHYAQSNNETTEELERLALKYKTIFVKSPLPKFIYDYETLKFIEVNESALNHYGYTVEEFLSMTIRDIRPPDDLEKLKIDIELIKAGKKSPYKTWRHLKKNGETIIVEVMGHFIDVNKKKARLVIIKDVTEKIKAEEELQQSHAALRELASHLQNIREEERAGMAREVHDVLGQQITCIKMDVSWLSKQLPNDEPKVKQRLKELTSLLDDTAIAVRKIASALRPSILDDFGLNDALDWQAGDFEKRSGIKVHFRSELPPDISISKDTITGLFRICQESLTNVARHSQATEVTITVSQKDNQLLMTIHDNGKGFDVAKSAERKTLGLLGMKERTLMIDGKYEIDSAPGKGTTVIVSIPLANL